MQILVIGDSPVSLFWSAILSLNNHHVFHLHTNQSMVKTVETQKGILLKNEEGDQTQLCNMRMLLTFEEVLHALSEKEKKAPHLDIIIVFSTIPETQRRLNEMHTRIQKFLDLNLVFLCLQHGLGNVETISKFVPKNNLLFGSTVTHASTVREGTIRGTKNRPTSVWSASGLITEHMRNVLKELTNAGFPTTAAPEAEIMLWKKMAVNCSINVLSAICSLKIGSIWNDANNAGRDIVVQVAREVAQIAQLEGIKLSEQDAVDAVAFVAQKASNHVSDMCNDTLNHKETSIEHLSGYVLRCAQKHNIVVHTTQTLYNIIKLVEDTYTKKLKPLSEAGQGKTDPEN